MQIKVICRLLEGRGCPSCDIPCAWANFLHPAEMVQYERVRGGSSIPVHMETRCWGPVGTGSVTGRSICRWVGQSVDVWRIPPTVLWHITTSEVSCVFLNNSYHVKIVLHFNKNFFAFYFCNIWGFIDFYFMANYTFVRKCWSLEYFYPFRKLWLMSTVSTDKYYSCAIFLPFTWDFLRNCVLA